jgi:hypothetical protein
MVGKGLLNMCDNRFQILALQFKHKESPSAQSHTIYRPVFLNAHLLHCSVELGDLVSEEDTFRCDPFHSTLPDQFSVMEGHGNLQ